MDPVTLIAAAVAAGAAAGVGDTGAQLVKDAYSGLKGLISHRYDVVAAEIVGVESEPEEPLRRQLLAKKLSNAGAGEDDQVQAAAREVLRRVAEYAPTAAATIGVRLHRVEAGGDIEISDVTVNAEDVSAGGSIRISGGRAGGGDGQNPSRPPR
ncbi:hypothetical protein [Nocardia salmonicida]|uniref:hypothetical protein n=1 Tax=Nocardia salmonicida TaxID=53431 RepID=UPI003792A267